MELLQGRIRDYAWGSRTAIAELQGRPVPSDGPEAELWLGAHPGAPATVDRDGTAVSLTELLLAEPAHWLGERVVGRFGTRLPFLLKVLAADAPLSLQAHPDAEQARVGHAADTERVNYVDPYHKPELLVALSEFEALCGFREPAESAAALAAFGVPALEPVVAALRTGPAGLREAVRLLLSWPAAERAGLVAAVLTAEVAGPDAVLARSLAVDYPADPGVLVALLLHHVRLAPGEAIWMPAGNLHAYLRGTGVEIMAASDNVLRGGLTPKRVDVDELLRVLRFEVLDEPVVAPVPVAPGVVTWPVPVDDFALHRVEVAGGPGVRLALPGPRVVLCRAGKLAVDDGVGAVVLGPGQAAVGTAAGGPLVLGGEGEAYVATCGLR
ncbi:mannose-6-phosphate isomerase, class I [Micromonospora sp. DR5-3]|uniref:mannose-6-phosphate isomerase, class I n=1 Tax=unclassified Micromonospora TaxID=2617518 RepID=UPI0011D9C7D5|nr:MULTISPECIES: mannose-6-phosphate isomerase, class I [unclassified Micromonospora]MCW3814694.1 mannose-6-phosphate isomerase, class I [Micromonospora sp. DR5-3]TYC23485.1 mannose-6-phosphate isomerase, class I [Micromonospora sp. MP36]